MSDHSRNVDLKIRFQSTPFTIQPVTVVKVINSDSHIRYLITVLNFPFKLHLNKLNFISHLSIGEYMLLVKFHFHQPSMSTSTRM